ncbi:decarboxylating 6-phosphogluconate dehydrogenase [Microlunatus panaciterrae]|uniref:6-phosphogluconate dehydrogenase n=1 Tax=Microlunatus panaciterrae TaxID=400768 RepID=A0ABS2RIU7_9ACTN|nr:decarboxylating 6-phosphogluconate dehydrogenase [Microlunatus panaciterrae]MBM7798928.1 6-phosphogluconate dehydrogenase [Microlunatus panaciterrae]
MEIGLVGLGKMGGNMRQRIRAGGHTVIGFDTNQDISDAKDLPDLVSQFTQSPKVVWVMVPVQAIDPVVDQLADLLDEGDIIIDGGNTLWSDDRVRADKLAEKGIHFLDCGVSGGVWGLENGYALMVGGDEADVATVQPVFDALKPVGDFGFVHAGPHGAGHFAKMVHNGMEYAIMQAYAEGWELLETADVVTDVPATFESWREGTVIRSWLLDLMVRALKADNDLSEIKGYAEDSGEGRWMVDAAIDLAVPVPALTAALFARFVSRQDESPAMKMVAAMRNQFGGHAVKTESPSLDDV